MLHHKAVRHRRAARLAISVTIDETYLLQKPSIQELSGVYDINAAIVSLCDECLGAWAHAIQTAVLAVCEEFAFVSLSLNPGLTHAILISLLRDNHDPEREGRENERAHIHIAFPL